MVLAVAAVLVVGSAVSLALTKKDKSLPATQVTGVSIVPQSQAIAAENVADFPVSFGLPNATSVARTWAELGITFQEVAPKVLVNEMRLNQTLMQLTQAYVVPATDATLTIKDGQVTVNPEINGKWIDVQAVAAAVVNKAEQHLSGSIQISTQVTQPAVTAFSLNPLRQQLVTLLQGGLSIVTPEHTYVVTPGELGSWITVGSTGYSFNDDLLRKKVRGIAREQDQAAVPTKIIGTTKEVVEPGQPGIVVDQEATYLVLRDALLAGLVTRKLNAVTTVQQPTEVSVASNAAPSSNVGKVIRVVLSEQRLYAWENGELAKTFLISSGLTGPTPIGNWAIFDKTYVQAYAGPGYYLPNVHYNSWFYPEIAIHEAYWHNNFGQPMSHGCVNARIEDAQFVYDWAPMGTPVEVVP